MNHFICSYVECMDYNKYVLPAFEPQSTLFQFAQKINQLEIYC